jgi:hypothetical protein
VATTHLIVAEQLSIEMRVMPVVEISVIIVVDRKFIENNRYPPVLVINLSGLVSSIECDYENN